MVWRLWGGKARSIAQRAARPARSQGQRGGACLTAVSAGVMEGCLGGSVRRMHARRASTSSMGAMARAATRLHAHGRTAA